MRMNRALTFDVALGFSITIHVNVAQAVNQEVVWDIHITIKNRDQGLK